MNTRQITLRVPGQQEYALVLRLTLGGVALLKDLDAGSLDDLRAASDEAVDCLLHQGREAAFLVMTVSDLGDKLTVRVCAEYADESAPHDPADEDETAITRAVLETLVPEVDLCTCPCGCVEAISLTLKKAVTVGA